MAGDWGCTGGSILIDGKTQFNPAVNQDYSIVNQYAWMINENYMQKLSDGSTEGLFEGEVTSISEKIVHKLWKMIKM